MSRALVFAALMACAAAVPIRSLSSSSAEELGQFANFKRQFNKVYYDQHDEEYRLGVFVQNLRKIRAHNDNNTHKYTLGMNAFGDLTFEEFHAGHTGFLGARHRELRSRKIADLSHVKVADEIDWQAAGAVTGVKDQGQCGSCWSFSTTGSIEGAWFIAKGELVSLSEQQLMDCSKAQGDNSCEGGLMDYAFGYVISHGSICTEDSYPYTAADQDGCNESSCTFGASISSYQDVDTNEDALKAAVSQQPVSVAIEADQEAFQFYSGGVLTGDCGDQLDHGVLAVGFGTLDGTDYWKVKNSWGDSWGMNGYILLQRGIDQCGIADAASYPTV